MTDVGDGVFSFGGLIGVTLDPAVVEGDFLLSPNMLVSLDMSEVSVALVNVLDRLLVNFVVVLVFFDFGVLRPLPEPPMFVSSLMLMLL